MDFQYFTVGCNFHLQFITRTQMVCVAAFD